MGNPKKITYVDAQLYAMLQAIQGRVAKDPGWRVVARGRDWLCPYCGEVGFSGYDAQKAPREILKHLVHSCPHWGEDVGTRFSQKQLVAKARRLDTEELLRTNRAWRMADGTGRWYCPYCAQATAVAWRSDSTEPSPDPDEAYAHLEQCAANRDGRKPYPVEVLTAITHDADRWRELTVAVRCKIEKDPAWQHVANGKWVCPRCRQVLPEVDFATDVQRQTLAPGRITRHLMERCKPHKEEPPPHVVVPRETVTHETTMLVLHDDDGEEEPPPDAARAREIIQGALPTQPPVLAGYDIHCLYRPAKEVGGTFHDCFYLSPEDAALLICGLQSRGMEAANTIAALKKSLVHHTRHHRSPGEVLKRVNEDLTGEGANRALVTALYGVLDGRTGVFTYARAGHNMPVLFNAQDDPPVRELSSRGLALGLQRGAAFDQVLEEVAIRFRHGDTLVLHAGGVTEAEKVSSQPYGVARLGAVLIRAQTEPTSSDLAVAIFQDVRLFLGDVPQKDDVALICVRCA